MTVEVQEKEGVAPTDLKLICDFHRTDKGWVATKLVLEFRWPTAKEPLQRAFSTGDEDREVKVISLEKFLGARITTNLKFFVLLIRFALESKKAAVQQRPLGVHDFIGLLGWSQKREKGQPPRARNSLSSEFTARCQAAIFLQQHMDEGRGGYILNEKIGQIAVDPSIDNRGTGSPGAFQALYEWMNLPSSDWPPSSIEQRLKEVETEYDPHIRHILNHYIREEIRRIEELRPTAEQLRQDNRGQIDESLAVDLASFREKLINQERRILNGICNKISDPYKIEPKIANELGYYLYLSIAQGSFGEVWRAYDKETRQWIAIKILRERWQADKTRRDRFIHGAEVQYGKLANVEHVVGVIAPPKFTSTRNGSYVYFCMPYMAGGSLRQMVKDGFLTQELILFYFMFIGEALESSHELGIIHRDIKPDNILFDIYGHVHLSDFDLVWERGKPGLTITGERFGTPPYMPPEYSAARGFQEPSVQGGHLFISADAGLRFIRRRSTNGS